MPMRLERLEVELLQVRRVRLQDDLELIIVLQPVRVLAVAPVLRAGGTAAHRPRARASGPSARKVVAGWKRAGADFHVVGLQDRRSPARPNSAGASGSGPGRSARDSCARVRWSCWRSVPGDWPSRVLRRTLEIERAGHQDQARTAYSPRPAQAARSSNVRQNLAGIDQALRSERSGGRTGGPGATAGRADHPHLHLVAEALAQHRPDVAEAVDEAEFHRLRADPERAGEQVGVVTSSLVAPARLRRGPTNSSWMRACSAFRRSTSSGSSGRNGSSIALFSPAVWTRRSMPKRSISRLKPKLAETTPMEPTMDAGSAKISSAAQAIM